MAFLLAVLLAIPSPAPPSAARPFLFAARDSVLLSWLEPGALRFARYRNGAWSEPRTIASSDQFFVNWADFPSIVEDRDGVLYAHWLEKSSGDTYAYDVRMSISNDGGKTWISSFLLNRDGKKNEHGFASLAPLPSGVAATWLDGRNMVEGKEEGEMTIRYATIDARGAIANETQLDARTCECCTTGMAMTSSGPLIAYRDRSADEIRDIVVARRTSKGWTQPRIVHADNWKMNGCPVNGPQVDAIGSNVAIAWFTGANDRARAFVAFSDDAGATFGAPIAIDEGKPAGRVDVVLLDRDTALVTWLELAEVRARVVHRGGSVDASIKVADTTSARAAGFPRIARLGNDVFVAWRGANGIAVARLALPSARK